jgi:uncharacterized protein YlxP (DUF503 family)
VSGEAVFVGVGKVWLAIAGCGSLKEKRGVLKPLLHRARETFGASAAEVGQADVWDRAVVGFAVIGTGSRHIDSWLARLVADVRRWKRVEVVGLATEKLAAGGAAMPPEARCSGDGAVGAIEEEWLRADGGGDEG